MADQVYNVNCGFFDSIDNDRLYSADEMNNPYKRLVSNGVFATNYGNPSTDLQVSPGGGRTVHVAPGQGLFGGKWFENPAIISIDVPANTAIVSRVDSVIAQVDTRTSGRTGSIVYRTGTPSANPQAPDIGLIDGVHEYRLANVTIPASASTVNAASIMDMRGSTECPWVTSLIKQVDTSALFAQWQSAYQDYYARSTADFEDYVARQRAAFEQFMSALTSDLTVSTNVVQLGSVTQIGASTTGVQINIPSYDQLTDVLAVYVDGKRYIEGKDYEIIPTRGMLRFRDPLATGAIVNCIALKSLIGADIDTTVTMLQALDTQIGILTKDSGWIDIEYRGAVTAANAVLKPFVRLAYKTIELRGAVKGASMPGTPLCTLPYGVRPSNPHIYVSAALYNINTTAPTMAASVVLQINPDGTIYLASRSAEFSGAAAIPLDTVYTIGDMVDLSAPVISVTASSGVPVITWAAVANAASYKIYRAPLNGEYALIGSTTGLDYIDNSELTSGTRYYYKVCAIDVYGYSGPLSAYKYITAP